MSGARVPYHLRQNKHVERELFLNLLSRVGRTVSLCDYLYVGFGGPFFEDFKAIHSRFGIKHMLSIEMDEWVFKRQQNNIPYGIVKCKNMKSSQLIGDFSKNAAEFPKAKHILCWLDYASPKQLGTQLAEVRALLPKLNRCDIVKVTFNANPATLGSPTSTKQHAGANAPEDRLKYRLDRLRSRLGNAFPGNVAPEDLEPEKYPSLLLKVMKLQISEAMKENPRLMFQPLGCYVYADSDHQMLTCTGVLLKYDEQRRFLKSTGLSPIEFASPDWEIHKIDVPYLSTREKLLLDRKMFQISANKMIEEEGLWFDENKLRAATMIENYGRLYRFYPHYHRIQY